MKGLAQLQNFCRSFLFFKAVAFCPQLFLVAIISLVSMTGLAEEGDGYVAKIEAHTPKEIRDILERAEVLVDESSDLSEVKPIALILHGKESAAFLRNNYDEYRDLVDLAAKLDAFDVVDVQICETWMRINDVDRSQLPAFVNTVPYGPREEKKLLGSGFIYF